jgi:hypothetical protein
MKELGRRDWESAPEEELGNKVMVRTSQHGMSGCRMHTPYIGKAQRVTLALLRVTCLRTASISR